MIFSLFAAFSSPQRNHLPQIMTCVVFVESDQFCECLFDGTGRLDGKEPSFFTPGSTMAGADAGEALITKEILQSTVLVQELLRSWPTKVNGCPITPFQTGSECVISCKISIFTGFGLTSCL